MDSTSVEIYPRLPQIGLPMDKHLMTMDYGVQSQSSPDERVLNLGLKIMAGVGELEPGT